MLRSYHHWRFPWKYFKITVKTNKVVRICTTTKQMQWWVTAEKGMHFVIHRIRFAALSSYQQTFECASYYVNFKNRRVTAVSPVKLIADKSKLKELLMHPFDPTHFLILRVKTRWALAYFNTFLSSNGSHTIQTLIWGASTK